MRNMHRASSLSLFLDLFSSNAIFTKTKGTPSEVLALEMDQDVRTSV